jgi:hypothetical protein
LSHIKQRWGVRCVPHRKIRGEVRSDRRQQTVFSNLAEVVIHDGSKVRRTTLGLSETSRSAVRSGSDDLTRIQLVSDGQSRFMYVISESRLAEEI